MGHSNRQSQRLQGEIAAWPAKLTDSLHLLVELNPTSAKRYLCELLICLSAITSNHDTQSRQVHHSRRRGCAATGAVTCAGVVYSWTFTPHGRLDLLFAVGLRLAGSLPPPGTTPVEEERAEFRNLMRQWQGDPRPPPQVEDRQVPGPNNKIPIRVFSPLSGDGQPILVYYHGGAFGSAAWTPMIRSAETWPPALAPSLSRLHTGWHPSTSIQRRWTTVTLRSSGCMPTRPKLAATQHVLPWEATAQGETWQQPYR